MDMKLGDFLDYCQRSTSGGKGGDERPLYLFEKVFIQLFIH